MATLRPPDGTTEGWSPLEHLRLRRALALDNITDRGRTAASNPAYPEGGLVKALADELGVSVESLLEWGASRDDDVLTGRIEARRSSHSNP